MDLYRTLCDKPLDDHNFMPPRFKKGDPFFSVTMPFPTYLKWDDFLANAWLQLCGVSSIGQSELLWFQQKRLYSTQSAPGLTVAHLAKRAAFVCTRLRKLIKFARMMITY